MFFSSTTCTKVTSYLGSMVLYIFMLRSLVNQWGVKLGLLPTAEETPATDAGPAESLAVSYLLPLHGPVVVGAVQELVRDYVLW